MQKVRGGVVGFLLVVFLGGRGCFGFGMGQEVAHQCQFFLLLQNQGQESSAYVEQQLQRNPFQLSVFSTTEADINSCM